MSTVVLNVQPRNEAGTRYARRTRNEGAIPAVVYGDNTPPEAISVPCDIFMKEFRAANFFSNVFELVGVGKKGGKYTVKDIQYHPVTDQPIHVDFYRVAKGSKVAVKINIHFINQDKSPGLKKGAVLNILAHEMEVLCDPEKIPESIDIDMTGTEFHHTIHAFDVVLPASVTLPVSVKNYTIATVVAPTIIKDVEPTTEG